MKHKNYSNAYFLIHLDFKERSTNELFAVTLPCYYRETAAVLACLCSSISPAKKLPSIGNFSFSFQRVRRPPGHVQKSIGIFHRDAASAAGIKRRGNRLSGLSRSKITLSRRGARARGRHGARSNARLHRNIKLGASRYVPT